jgi:hypothetical protein
MGLFFELAIKTLEFKASYQNGKDLCDVTLCMFAVTNRGKQTLNNVKSLYGLKETIATSRGLKESTGKRGQVRIF